MNIFERVYPSIILLTLLYVIFIIPPLLKPCGELKDLQIIRILGGLHENHSKLNKMENEFKIPWGYSL